MFRDFRLGKHRRALLQEALRGPAHIAAGATKSEQSARYRAATGLVGAGLAVKCRVACDNQQGWTAWRAGIKLTDTGVLVARAYAPELRQGQSIRWDRFDRLAEMFSPEAYRRADAMLAARV